VDSVLGRTRPHGLNLKEESRPHGLRIRKSNVHGLSFENSPTLGKYPDIGEETNVMGST